MSRGSVIMISLASAACFAGTWAAAPALGLVADAAQSNPAPAAPRKQGATAPVPDVYFAGCNEARAAGAAPIYRGQPGYRAEMDGDDDGIACEPHRNLWQQPHLGRRCRTVRRRVIGARAAVAPR